jgi:hypothetical protein
VHVGVSERWCARAGVVVGLRSLARAPRQVLLVVGSFDRDFTQDAQDLARAMPRAKLVAVDTSDHGTALLPDPAPTGGTIADAVTAFVIGALGGRR